ncbi:Rv0361 family membrane protein [Actinoplanes sp. URMC 104]|uniref:Rv0361 family membrane protein n=1 Tax=Actinoplanes sp. URMC 104 TaxID=3423409 RepID=UPI003F197471
MQPQEPVTEPTDAPAGAEPAKKAPNRRLRLWLAMGAGVLALLCLGGVGVAVLLYDEETKIERAEPDAVADNFLRAYLVNRDDARAALYQCRSGGDFQQIAAYRADVLAREKQFTATIAVTWKTIAVRTNGANAEAETDLVKTTSSQPGRVTDTWRLNLVDEDGWRVCGATQTS